MLAAMELAKLVIAEDLGMTDPQQLIIISQPDFHIDQHLRPLRAKDNAILLYSPAENIKLLTKALANVNKQQSSSNNPELEAEKQGIKDLLATVRSKAKTEEKTASVIDNELTEAGMNVIRAPGAIANNEGKLIVNFLNAIVTEACDSSSLEMITMSCKFPSVMHEFKEEMRKQHDINTEFVADLVVKASLPNKPSGSYHASEIAAEMEGGLDCMTEHKQA